VRDEDKRIGVERRKVRKEKAYPGPDKKELNFPRGGVPEIGDRN
jgi:hypothetical protein